MKHHILFLFALLLAVAFTSCDMTVPPPVPSDSPWDPENPAPPRAPDTLRAVVISSTAIRLSWADRSGNETGFSMERKTGVGAWVADTTFGSDVMGYTDTRLTPDTTYTYRVQAFNGAGSSEYTTVASATPILKAPTGLTAMVKSFTSIDLSWVDNSIDELGFKVERKVGAGAYLEIKVLPVNSTVYTDTGLATGTTYTYRVRAYTQTEISGYGNEASATRFTTD